MAQFPFQIFILLGTIFLLSAFIRFIFQKIKLFDFIAYIVVGVLIGLMLKYLPASFNFFQNIHLEDDNLWRLLLFIGILFYFARLMSNFNPTFLNLNLKNSLSSGFIYLIIFSISIIVYAVLFQTEFYWKTAVLMSLVLLPINIGPIMNYDFPGITKIKTELILLLQIAVWIDILVILFFSIGHTIVLAAHSIQGVNAILDFSLFLFTSILFFLFVRFNRWKSLDPRLISGIALLIFNGLLLLLIAFGTRIGLSPILLGILLGWGLKQFSQEAQNQLLKYHEYFENYFILLIFVEMGRLFIQQISLNLNIFRDSLMLLIFIFLATIIFTLFLIIRTKLSYKHIIGLAARGEVSLVMVWILAINRMLSPQAWGTILISVLISVILVQYYYLILKGILTRENFKGK